MSVSLQESGDLAEGRRGPVESQRRIFGRQAVANRLGRVEPVLRCLDERQRDRAGKYSIAMLCALTLVDSKRMPSEQRENFLSIIANNIAGTGLSEIERRFAERKVK